MQVLLMLLVFSFGAWQEQEEESRVWSDKSGKFTVEAKLVVDPGDSFSGPVKLIKIDGKEISVEFDLLDDNSQALVRKRRMAAKSAASKLRKSEMPAKEKKKEENDGESGVENSQQTDDTADSLATDNSWHQWRGPNRDGISLETNLLKSWPEAGPELLWTAKNLGAAMSSVVIKDGRIFTMGNRDGVEYLIALNEKDGSEIWASSAGTGGESNSTPTVDGDLVFSIGRGGTLTCANAATGETIWQKNFESDFGGKMMSQWGYSESPLVDNDRVVCTPGGVDAMIISLDKKTGATIWKTPMPPGGDRGQDGAGYSSLVVSHGGGVKQYVTLVGRGLISVAAEDGKALWQYEKIANGTANVPTPIVDGDYIFCSSGYNDGGTALLKLSGKRRAVNYSEVYYLRNNQIQNHHGGMIKIGDYVYMGEGHNEGFPMCIEFKTGKPTWPKQRGVGTGSAAIVAADGHLYFRYQNGIMALIEADPKEYKLKSSFRIASVNRESWPHPVISGGKLYLRDQDLLHCYDISD